MARKTTADDGSFQHVERGKEGSRAVTHVIMSHGAAAALLHRQSGLGAIQRLDLTLLIHTKHQRLVGRVEIEAHYVAEFFDKVIFLRKRGQGFLLFNQLLGLVKLPSNSSGD